jgi:hypothetical protein
MRIGLAIFSSSFDTNRAAFFAKHDHCLPRSFHSVNSLGLTPTAALNAEVMLLYSSNTVRLPAYVWLRNYSWALRRTFDISGRMWN